MKKYKNIWTVYLFNPRNKKYVPYWYVASESALKRAAKLLRKSGYRFMIRKKKLKR
jgi:hypothetical protein